jgi:alcohol dehydrogenase class IV
MSLKELGLKKEDLAKAADIASKAQYPNPAPLDREKLLTLLENAWEGNAPAIM